MDDIGIIRSCLKDLRLESRYAEGVADQALAALDRIAKPEAPSNYGTSDNPFTATYNSKCFKRHDSELFVSIGERDDGFELAVIPSRTGPCRHYRINADGSWADLAPPEAPDSSKGEADEVGSLEWLYGACSEIEVALECLARRQGFRPAYADNALKKIREKSPEYLAARRPSADPATDARELVRIIRQPTGRSPEESYESAEDRAAERLAPEIERFAQARSEKAEAEAKELREALEQAYRDFDELSGAMEGDYDFVGIRNYAAICKCQARAALDAGKEK